LKILLISSPQSHRRAWALGNNLSLRGNEVTLISADKMLSRKLTLYRCDLKTFYNLPSTGMMFDYFGYFLRLPFYIDLTLLKGLEVDIIHFFTPSQPYVTSGIIIANILKRITSIATVLDWDEPWGKGGLSVEHGQIIHTCMSFLEIFNMKAAKSITVGGYLLKELLLSLGVSTNNIIVIHNGYQIPNLPPRHVARHALGFEDDTITLIYIGKYTPNSYRNLIIETFRYLSSDGAKFRLLIVGDRFWKAQSFPAIVRDNIISLGVVPLERIGTYLAASDIALLPLDNNPFDTYRYPLRLSDYMYAGLPIVASDVGESALVIKKNNCGLLAKPGDARDFANQIIMLAHDEDLKRSLGENSRRAAKKFFSWESAATKTEKIYRTLIEKG
jgi:glycosyltransferase involved in cell wall biosynthesis